MGGENLVQHAHRILPTSLHLRRVHPHGIDARIWWQHEPKRLPLLYHLLAPRVLEVFTTLSKPSSPDESERRDRAHSTHQRELLLTV
jgi:hypothetical protein